MKSILVLCYVDILRHEYHLMSRCILHPEIKFLPKMALSPFEGHLGLNSNHYSGHESIQICFFVADLVVVHDQCFSESHQRNKSFHMGLSFQNFYEGGHHLYLSFPIPFPFSQFQFIFLVFHHEVIFLPLHSMLPFVSIFYDFLKVFLSQVSNIMVI